MNFLKYILPCLVLGMFLCGCTHHTIDLVDDDEIEVGPENKDTQKNQNVSLTYCFRCYADLLEFVNPVIIYTDKDGQHELELNEKVMSAKRYADCYYQDSNGLHFSTFELEANDAIQEPWIVEKVYTVYEKSLDVKLEQFNIENTCSAYYKKKPSYVIDPTKKYDLSRFFGCVSGSSTGAGIKVYTSTSIHIGNKTSWETDEVEPYITELCTHTDAVTMVIDENGAMSKKK